MGVIMLPIVALTTEEALKLIPMSYRLGSSALGVPVSIRYFALSCQQRSHRL
ncbi:MAG UNVERIFIED_CONTAM: hypothetical protein LVR29_07405 [Microcystis novacekii LVE1205-3]